EAILGSRHELRKQISQQTQISVSNVRTEGTDAILESALRCKCTWRGAQAVSCSVERFQTLAAQRADESRPSGKHQRGKLLLHEADECADSDGDRHDRR